jgi:Sulfotransferase family
MLLSFEHNFVYVKTRKTASTSIEMLLSQFMTSAYDIVTTIDTGDDLVRLRDGVRARNHDVRGSVPDRRIVFRVQFWNHMSARQIKVRLEPELWDKVYKITSERHPYEKAVSSAYQRYANQGERGSFAACLDEVVARGRYRNFDLYTIGDRPVPDFIIRFESLQADMQQLLRQLSLPTDVPLPSAKSTHRKDRRLASEILSESQKARIRRCCAEEFKLFGYEP